MDGDSSTIWSTTSGARPYYFAQVDLNGTFSISKIDLELGTTTGSAPAAFEIQYEDQGCYKTISQTDIANNPSSTRNHSFSFSTPIVTSKLRFVCKVTGYCRARTLKAFGVATSANNRPASTCSAGVQVPSRFGAYDFAQFLPTNYNADPSAKFPLIVVMHGIGGETLMADHTAIHGWPEGLASQLTQSTFRSTFPAIVVSPHCRETGSGDSSGDCWFDIARIDKLLEFARQTYRVDNDRIYMSGISGGGMRTMNYAYYHHEKLAAVVPIAGGWDGIPSSGRGFSNGTPVLDADGRHLCDLKELAIYGIHGTNDWLVSPAGALNLWNAFAQANQCNAIPKKAIVKFVPGGDHNGTLWHNNGYADQRLYDWLFTQRLSNKGSELENNEPTVSAGADVTMTVGQNISITGTASDSDGSISQTSWVDISSSSKWPVVTNGSSVNLSSYAAGTYRWRFIATDNKGASRWDDIYIKINP